jgi:hypothetical protein
MNTMFQAPRGSRVRTAVGLAGVLMLAACASTPPAPTASLQAAQQAIDAAERVEAGRYAASELDDARTQLASADKAVSEQRMIMAQQFAENSRANAELASARAADAKAKEVNEEMKRSTSTLVEELRRTSGDKP